MLNFFGYIVFCVGLWTKCLIFSLDFLTKLPFPVIYVLIVFLRLSAAVSGVTVLM